MSEDDRLICIGCNQPMEWDADWVMDDNGETGCPACFTEDGSGECWNRALLTAQGGEAPDGSSQSGVPNAAWREPLPRAEPGSSWNFDHPILAAILRVRRINAGDFSPTARSGNEFEAYDQGVLDCYHAVERIMCGLEPAQGGEARQGGDSEASSVHKHPVGSEADDAPNPSSPSPEGDAIKLERWVEIADDPDAIVACGERWKAVAARIGCSLHGFDDGRRASFTTPDGNVIEVGPEWRAILESRQSSPEGDAVKLAAELEDLIARSHKEADDIRYYSGGSQTNWSMKLLAEAVCRNADRILTALRQSSAPVLDRDAVRFDFLQSESYDLRCFPVPTGGDDADIGWRVVGHWQAQPRERTIAEVYHDNPRDAVDAAMNLSADELKAISHPASRSLKSSPDIVGEG